jgi:class 3 adenylate cyclase
MRSPKCGSANREKVAFCNQCGASLSGVTGNPDTNYEYPSAERRRLTVMFCDLVGSTELSGRLDPEELHDLTRQYQRVCADVTARHGGYVAQYLGDGLLVFLATRSRTRTMHGARCALPWKLLLRSLG